MLLSFETFHIFAQQTETEETKNTHKTYIFYDGAWKWKVSILSVIGPHQKKKKICKYSVINIIKIFSQVFFSPTSVAFIACSLVNCKYMTGKHWIFWHTHTDTLYAILCLFFVLLVLLSFGHLKNWCSLSIYLYIYETVVQRGLAYAMFVIFLRWIHLKC